MGGTPDLWGQSLCVQAEFQEEVGSRRPCSQTQTSQELGFCLLRHDGRGDLSQYEF